MLIDKVEVILKGGDGKTNRDEIKSAYEDIAKLLSNHTGYFLYLN